MKGHRNLRYHDCLLEIIPMPTSDRDDGECLIDLLRLVHAIQTLQGEFFARYDLSLGGFAAMVMICAREGVVCRPSEIATAIGVTRATVTGLLDTLEGRGYVTRGLDPNDRRSMRVESTFAGREALARVLKGYSVAVAMLMENISETDRLTLRGLLASVPESLPLGTVVEPAPPSEAELVV